MNTDTIIELGKFLTEACVIYYDAVNDTGNLDICVGMSADVKISENGKRYRYNVKIEKEEIEND